MTDAWGDLATYRQKKRQKFKVYLTKGVSVNPKAYCCNDNTINDQKPPVAILVATPNPIFEGEDLTLDMTGSYDPDGGGIADPGGYHIWDGIGGEYAATKTEAGITYANAGRFEARGVVTDADGLMGEASTWVEVLSANGVNPPEPPGDWRKSVYLASKVRGIYFTDEFTGPGGADPEWVRVNTGLASLATTQIIGDPFDPAGRQYTQANWVVYRRTGGDWTPILNETIIENDLAVDIYGHEGDSMIIRCNVNAEGHIYALVDFKIQPGGANNYKVYFCKSVDYGENWAYTLIYQGHTATAWRTAGHLKVGAFQGSSSYAAGQVIYATYGPSQYYLKVSTDQGASFPDAPITLPWCGFAAGHAYLSIDPSDQDIIYLVTSGYDGAKTEIRLYKSLERGANLIDLITCIGAKPMSDAPSVYIWDNRKMMMAGGLEGSGGAGYAKAYVVNYSGDAGVTFTEYVNTDDFTPDRISRVMDAPELLYGTQSNNPDGGDMQHVIAVSADRGLHWEGKAGDDPVTPSATSIPNDCGGVAGILQIWTEE